MHEADDKELRAAWSRLAAAEAGRDVKTIVAAIRKREREAGYRDRVLYLCAAVIIPSGLAGVWFLPDLRVTAAIVALVGAWLVFQTYRRSGLRVAFEDVEMSCLAFQRALLQRERDVYRQMPAWYLPPVVASQVAILYGLFTSPRIPRTAMFPFVIMMFVTTVVVILVVARTRWRRQLADLQREMDALTGGDAH